MQYLSKEIAQLVKKKAQHSLVQQQKSCGIFQNYGPHDLEGLKKKQ